VGMEVEVSRLLVSVREQPDVFEAEAFHRIWSVGFGLAFLDRVHASLYPP
jgi:hypothetical protein